MLDRTSQVIMNVGCNKGHDSIAWLQRFDQHRFWNLRRLKFQQQMMGGKTTATAIPMLELMLKTHGANAV